MSNLRTITITFNTSIQFTYFLHHARCKRIKSRALRFISTHLHLRHSSSNWRKTYVPVALTPRRTELVTKRSDENTCHLMKWPNMFTMFTNTVKWWQACSTLLSWHHQVTSQVVWQVTVLSLLRK